MGKIERDAQIAKLVVDEELVLDGDRFWVAIVGAEGKYLAAWIDENGRLRTAYRKSASGAVKLASSSWGQ